MNFPKRRCPLVIAFLSITIAARESLSSVEPETNQRNQPFWQFVLREFVFKTISSSRYRDDELYKKLQAAPFFGGSLPIASSDLNAAVSRGNVYKTLDGQWILCQEGCAKCELCDQQLDDPVVKWTLRRVRRLTSLDSPKWDLRLTVVPQMDETFRIGKHPRRHDDAYVMNQGRAGGKSAREPVPSSTKQEFTFERAQEANLWGSSGAERYLDSRQRNEAARGDSRGASVRIKRYRSRRRPPLTYHDPDEDINGVKSLVQIPEDDVTPRLIVGIDQHGKKHLVHLVPVNSPLRDLEQPTNYATNYQPSNNWDHAARISRGAQQEAEGPSYEKLIERILDSFDTHRNFIEKFLFSDRLASANEGKGPLSYPESGDERLEGRNLEGYRIDDPRQVNRYTDSEYQVEQQGEQFRNYADVRRAVNKPYGEYQDENPMIEYEPYEGRRLENQDERSRLPLADAERKRRNSFAKLMDSTVGHQPPHQNHTRVDASDTEFSINQDFPEDSDNQQLVNSSLRVNRTDARIRKLPEVSAASGMQTLGSDD